MYERWPFFRSVIDNMGMVLAKADSASARCTPTPWCPTRSPAGGSWTASSPSTRSTVAWHARITGSDDPLADNPTLARSIRNRYPYLDPLHVMQVELLRRHRAGDDDERSSSEASS